MFGYVKTDTPNTYVKDDTLYRAMYCGLCKGIGKCCNQRARLALNYDLTFLSVLMHNLLDVDVKINKERCIVHWLRTRPVAGIDDLTLRIANLNVIMAYHKLSDDVIDSGKGKTKRSFFKSAYKKAVKSEPKFDQIVCKWYDRLMAYEKTNGDSVDISADFFGNMLKETVVEILKDKTTEPVKLLAYNLGKWVYLIDALDDFDKDKKTGSFNVFVNAYPETETKAELVLTHGNDLEFIFSTVLGDIAQLTKNLDYKFNHDLTDNILLRGLNVETKRIFNGESDKKQKKKKGVAQDKE